MEPLRFLWIVSGKKKIGHLKLSQVLASWRYVEFVLGHWLLSFFFVVFTGFCNDKGGNSEKSSNWKKWKIKGYRQHTEILTFENEHKALMNTLTHDQVVEYLTFSKEVRFMECDKYFPPPRPFFFLRKRHRYSCPISLPPPPLFVFFQHYKRKFAQWNAIGAPWKVSAPVYLSNKSHYTEDLSEFNVTAQNVLKRFSFIVASVCKIRKSQRPIAVHEKEKKKKKGTKFAKVSALLQEL